MSNNPLIYNLFKMQKEHGAIFNKKKSPLGIAERTL